MWNRLRPMLRLTTACRLIRRRRPKYNAIPPITPAMLIINGVLKPCQTERL
ncbi:hypothetical protein D3C71_2130180 [compost metagenome]